MEKYIHLKTSPFNVPYYNATDAELEHFMLFCVCVPGKSALQIARKVDALLGLLKADAHTSDDCFSPFDVVVTLSPDQVNARLRQVKMGRYQVLTRTLLHLAWMKQQIEGQMGEGHFLRDTPYLLQRLLIVPGIGPKTARFFITFTRRNARVAVLDTHILAWMRDNHKELGLKKSEIPKQTPGLVSKYQKLEEAYLQHCERTGVHPADFDFSIWKSRAKQIA